MTNKFEYFICGQLEDCESCKEIDRIAEAAKNQAKLSAGRPKLAQGEAIKPKSMARVAGIIENGLKCR